MQTFRETVHWYVQHKNDIDFIKDIIFAIGLIATFYGYYKILRLLTQRKLLNKRQEMEYDSKLYTEIKDKLKEYIEEFDMAPKNLRDVGIRLLYIKNYPYNLDNDGFPFMLYYYFITERHQPSGYISGKGIYVMEYLWSWGGAVYYNGDNGKWFTAKKGLTFKGYQELPNKQLVKRIPFANILGYDFNSDWADKGEPVFYTRYRYTDARLYADELDAVSNDNGEYPLDRVSLQESKRAKRIRTFKIRITNKAKAYFNNRKTSKVMNQKKIKKK